MKTNPSELTEKLWSYYDQHARVLPWREPLHDGTFSSYHILVSELMLQQTQVDRVIPKYKAFIAVFPTIQSLAKAELVDCIELWNGLGYNRRAKYLYEIARALQGREFPQRIEELTQFKGIGYNTAAAVLVYTYNQPLLFVETNIRTVVLHHLLTDQSVVTDNQILDSLAVLHKHSAGHTNRDFYWALMDYGSHLKRSGVRTNHLSKHYAKQSVFEGSLRQIRGKILRLALTEVTEKDLISQINDERAQSVLESLIAESLVESAGGVVRIAKI